MLVVVNVVSFFQAWAMTHFVEAGTRTSSVENLSHLQKLKVLLTGVRLPRPSCLHHPGDLGFQYEALRLIGAKGLEIEVWRIPKAQAKGVVLLFHGYGGSKDSMLEPAKEYQGFGYETWLVDFHGSGGSGGKTTSLGWHEAQDVEAVFARARREFSESKIICHGSSMGAVAVLRAAHLGEIKPAALVLECPFNRMLDTVKNRFRLMKLPAFPLAHCLVFWGGLQQGFNAFSHNPEVYVSQARCPMLILHGEKDTRATLPQVRQIASRAGTYCELKTFPNLGHESFVFAEREEWRRAVSVFLARSVR